MEHKKVRKGKPLFGSLLSNNTRLSGKYKKLKLIHLHISLFLKSEFSKFYLRKSLIFKYLYKLFKSERKKPVFLTLPKNVTLFYR